MENNIQPGTIKERLARLEILMCNHISHHELHDKWMLGILGSLVVGVILLAIGVVLNVK